MPSLSATRCLRTQTVNTPQLVQQFLAQQQRQQRQQAGTAEECAAQAPTPPALLGPQPIRLDVGENRHFYLPPPGETRLVPNEMVLQLPCDVPQNELNAILKQHNLAVVASQCLPTGGHAAYRMRHASSQTIANVIRALAAHRIIAAAQANYVYTLAEETSVQSVTSEQGDPGQYVPDKLRLSQIHRLVRGTNIPIAVIDSEIDGAHPDLSGAISDRFDATGVEDSPHAHGTGMAGAIVSRQKLLGVAPGARILAIRAFASRAASGESTTYNILKGLDWAVDNNVRIVNMSFAGPRDPSLERALKAAYDKGVILIAAAGNAGPRALPLFPAADPHVIAVTATDIDRPAVYRRQSRRPCGDRGAGRRYSGAGAGRRVPGHDRNVGRDRPYQRRRRADAGAQSEAHARRCPQDPGGNRQAARAPRTSSAPVSSIRCGRSKWRHRARRRRRARRARAARPCPPKPACRSRLGNVRYSANSGTVANIASAPLRGQERKNPEFRQHIRQSPYLLWPLRSPSHLWPSIF